jgi:hypothetical protein
VCSARKGRRWLRTRLHRLPCSRIDGLYIVCRHLGYGNPKRLWALGKHAGTLSSWRCVLWAYCVVFEHKEQGQRPEGSDVEHLVDHPLPHGAISQKDDHDRAALFVQFGIGSPHCVGNDSPCTPLV